MKYTSPATDLAYFLGSSTPPELRREHLEEMLSFYHERLVQGLVRLGHSKDVYTFEDLKRDCKERFVILFVNGVLHAQVRKQSSLQF